LISVGWLDRAPSLMGYLALQHSKCFCAVQHQGRNELLTARAALIWANG